MQDDSCFTDQPTVRATIMRARSDTGAVGDLDGLELVITTVPFPSNDFRTNALPLYASVLIDLPVYALLGQTSSLCLITSLVIQF
jgi:hypothetical protein